MIKYIYLLIGLLVLINPVTATTISANQISSTELWVNGTGFDNSGIVTLSVETSILIIPINNNYLYELQIIKFSESTILELNAYPVNDDLQLYVKKNWLMVWTFSKNDTIINYLYNPSIENVYVKRSMPYDLTFQIIKVFGTSLHSNVNLNISIKENINIDENGSFNYLYDISGIPIMEYTICGDDGNNTACTSLYTFTDTEIADRIFDPIIDLMIVIPDTLNPVKNMIVIIFKIFVMFAIGILVIKIIYNLNNIFKMKVKK